MHTPEISQSASLSHLVPLAIEFVSLARFNGRSSYWRKVRFVPESDGEKSGFQSKKSEVEILLGETSNGTACTVKKEPMVAGEGKEKFLIRVSELTLLNHDRVQKASSTKKNVIDAAAMSVSHVSLSESSLVSDRKNTSFTGGKPMDSEEAFKAVFNDKFNGDGDPIVEEGRCVGELDILGSREAFNSGHNAFENHELFLEQRNNKQNASGGAELSWAQVVKGRCPNQENTEMLVINEGVKVGLHGKLDSDELANMIVHENVNGRVALQGGSKTIEDMRLMGFKNHELSTTEFSEDELNVEMIEGQDVIKQNEEKISWEAKVDALNRVVRSGEIENNDEIEGVANGSMLDLSKLRCVDHVKKDKKYGSLLSFQDKALSSLERLKRDKSMRKYKKKIKSLDTSELEGRSLTDSDIKIRSEILLGRRERL
ncbi:hypothetical protein V6N11_081094 [Hibiscus sabdariffa]|uniref:Uncharacterized protein n=1 Tax=Hibiscus sabdariffa TaxID=183260 RepID=A0ABR2QJ77_9ROSI